jgi:hypothetical protein
MSNNETRDVYFILDINFLEVCEEKNTVSVFINL